MEKKEKMFRRTCGQDNTAAEMIYGVFLPENWDKSEGCTWWKLNKVILIVSVFSKKLQEGKGKALGVGELAFVVRCEKSKPWKHFANIEIERMKCETKNVLKFYKNERCEVTYQCFLSLNFQKDFQMWSLLAV